MTRGEVLRIRQIEGEQCVDFNVFDLADATSHLSVGTMRRDGFRVQPGSVLWSNPPRTQALMAVLDLSDTCTTDLLGPRCTAPLFERAFGLSSQPNCQDTMAEAIREFGLRPEDVHDSMNMWMDTAWDDIGWYTSTNTGRRDDYIDLLALTDVLAVPIVCGSGNVFVTSNYAYHPIGIEVFPTTEDPSAMNLLQSYPASKGWTDVEPIRARRSIRGV